MKDMDKAVDRICTAIDERQSITIYGDYDADGITSTACLLSFLRSLGAQADYYIPDRLTEGVRNVSGSYWVYSERVQNL